MERTGRTMKVERIIELHSPDKLPKQIEGELFSEDVIVIDEKGLNGVAFYDYGLKEWGFHTDTLVDYNEKGNETKWMWYYPPISKELIK